MAYLNHEMRRLILLTLAVGVCSCGFLPRDDWKWKTKEATVVAPDSVVTAVSLIGYATSDSTLSDTVALRSGDSVFVYDGDLYYRARVNGRDFFIKSNDLLARSDSLVVFQTYRLTPPTVGEQPRGKASMDPVPASSKTIVRKRCTAITQNGTRCRRWAQPGSDKCWQHNEM